MATKEFLLPDLGEGLTEGEIVRWLVAVDDEVVVDQPLAEVETAKAVVEVPSPFSGRVTRLHAEVGDEVEVGKPLVTIDPDGGPAPPAAEAAPPEAAPTEAAAPAGAAGEVAEDAAAGDLVPEAKEEAPDGESGSVLVGYGTGGGARRRRRRGRQPEVHAAPAPSAEPPVEARRPLAKPPVRKLAKDLGIDLTTIAGTGPDGTITREDVESARMRVQEPDGRAPAGAEERIPVRGVRKRIAEKMTRSRQEIPEATTWVDCDATALWRLRDELNELQAEVRVSPLAVVLRAVVAGLRRFPEVNARLDTERNEIVRQHFVHLGVAVQTDRGLVVPVIRDAHERSTLQLAAELNRLAEACRAGTVGPQELQGGTFTVSNYGSFGVDGGSAVINHPEAAILGVGRITDRPWVVDGALAVRKVVQLSIAFDHRVCDGGEAAGFLRFVGDCVERPARLLADL